MSLWFSCTDRRLFWSTRLGRLSDHWELVGTNFGFILQIKLLIKPRPHEVRQKNWCQLRKRSSYDSFVPFRDPTINHKHWTCVLAAQLFPNQGENASSRTERHTSEVSYNHGVIYPDTSGTPGGGTTELKHLPSWTAGALFFPMVSLKWNEIEVSIFFYWSSLLTFQSQNCKFHPKTILTSNNKLARNPPTKIPTRFFSFSCRSHDDIDQRQDKGLDWA